MKYDIGPGVTGYSNLAYLVERNVGFIVFNFFNA